MVALDAPGDLCEAALPADVLDLRLWIGNSSSPDGTIELGPNDDLSVLIESGGAGLASVMARVSTGVDEPTTVVTTVRLDGESTARATFAADALGLPAERLSWSSNLMLTSRLQRDDGTYSKAEAADLWLHRDGQVWRLYDSAKRDEVFGGGALDRRAAASLRERADAESLGASTDGPPLATVRDQPEGWLPTDEAVPEEGVDQR